MHFDIIVIGGGAAGLMAAAGAGSQGAKSVLVLEKMPRPGRKIVITGKGRCNYTNLKDWNSFQPHIRANSNVLRSAFYNLTPEKLMDFFAQHGLESVVERGDRVFPASHKSMDVVDVLTNAVERVGGKIETEREVQEIYVEEEYGERIFVVNCTGGYAYSASRVIIATGGLSYPLTGSTGDGFRFATDFGHSLKPCFPSLTALVPKSYKEVISIPQYEFASDGLKYHIDRSVPLSETGKELCGVHLKNVGLSLEVNGTIMKEFEGDVDFTDGGIEGPLGFSVSRDAVKSLINGSKVALILNLKPGVPINEFVARVETLWNEVRRDSRSKGKNARYLLKVLLGKLMPWELIPGFMKCHTGLISGKKGYEVLKVKSLVSAVVAWRFEVVGYVGYERCVVTAGGVSADEIVPKTMESRKVKGLYFCGEVLDIDADTGGYNLHSAFAEGFLAGMSAAKSLEDVICKL